jgi:hypothetical protein
MESSAPPKEKIVVPVICATRDSQGAVAYSIATIWNALNAMGREPVYVQFAAHGYAFVRAGVFKELKKEFNTDRIRGILIDDDILIKDQLGLIQAITVADQYGWNFVAPYRVRDGYVALAHENGSLYTVEETRQLRPWDRVPNAGLGFYYGWLPLDYKFHEDGAFGGEDLNFFWDNPWIEPRVFGLSLKHIKSVELDMDTPIPTHKRPPSAGPHLERPLPPLDEEGDKRRIRE